MNIGITGAALAAIYAAIAYFGFNQKPSDIWIDTTWGLFWGVVIFSVISLTIRIGLTVLSTFFQGIFALAFRKYGFLTKFYAMTIAINTIGGIVNLIAFVVSRPLLILGAWFLMNTNLPQPWQFTTPIVVGGIMFLVGIWISSISFTPSTTYTYNSD